MSLLDRAREDIIVYPQVSWIDEDGNRMTGPSEVGIPMRASIQPQAQTGTSARRSEQNLEGFFSEQLCHLRFPRDSDIILGPQSRIEWRGEYWALFGDPRTFNSSDNTAHRVYSIKRT